MSSAEGWRRQQEDAADETEAAEETEAGDETEAADETEAVDETEAGAENAGRGGLMPNGRMSYLGTLECRAEWNPAQKVLTRHKNGANTPMILIIKYL